MQKEIHTQFKWITSIKFPWSWLKGNGLHKAKEGILETVNSQWICENSASAYETFSDKLATAVTIGTESSGEMLFNLSMQLVLCVSCDNTEQKLKHIITGLSNVYQWDIHHPAKAYLFLVCCLLSPSGFSAKGSLFSKTSCDGNTSPLYKSIRAYFASGYLFAIENLLDRNKCVIDTKDSSEVSEEKESDTKTVLQDDWPIILSILSTYKEDILDEDTMEYKKNEILKGKLAGQMLRQKYREKSDVTDPLSSASHENEFLKSGIPVKETINSNVPCIGERTEIVTSDNQVEEIHIKSLQTNVSGSIQKTQSVDDDNDDAKNKESKKFLPMIVNGSVQDLTVTPVDNIVTEKVESEIESNINDLVQNTTKQFLKLELEDSDNLSISKQKLTYLEEKCRKYLKERFSAPNPVFTLSKVRKICDYCIKMNGAECDSAKELLAECDRFWNRHVSAL